MFEWLGEKITYVWEKAKNAFVSTAVIFTGSWVFGKTFGWDPFDVEKKYTQNKLIPEIFKFTAIGTGLGIGLDAVLPKNTPAAVESSVTAQTNLPRNAANPPGVKLS
jgi:hypothetical protein